MTTSLADNVLTDEDTNAVKFHAKKYAKYYEPGILDMEHHIRLVEKLKDLSRKTNVPEYFVYKTRVSDYCSEAEIDYVRKLKTWSDNGVAGLAFTGSVGGVEDKMMSIAGAITRNMINVMVLPVQDLIARIKDGREPDQTVILIPNFFMSKGAGGDVPDWQISLVVGWLLHRFASGKQTILYASDLDECETVYGGMVRSHIENHYIQVS